MCLGVTSPGVRCPNCNLGVKGPGVTCHRPQVSIEDGALSVSAPLVHVKGVRCQSIFYIKCPGVGCPKSIRGRKSDHRCLGVRSTGVKRVPPIIFGKSIWKFVKITISWVIYVSEKSTWFDQNCGYYTIFNFWECLIFIDSDFIMYVICFAIQFKILSAYCEDRWHRIKQFIRGTKKINLRLLINCGRNCPFANVMVSITKVAKKWHFNRTFTSCMMLTPVSVPAHWCVIIEFCPKQTQTQ